MSGTTTLVRLNIADQSNITVLLNDRDITSSFHLSKRSGKLVALVDGLAPGKNVLGIIIDGTFVSRTEILVHPHNGPIFSGPHQRPFICQTEANGLGPALDADCNAAKVIEYYYKPTVPHNSEASTYKTVGDPQGEYSVQGFKRYVLSRPRPADVAQTTLSNGSKVPYIIRRETGVINRAIYEIQFLHEPGQPLPTPWTGLSAGWNGRLIYAFGGGCQAGYRQGLLSSEVIREQEKALSLGYAIATSTLNILANNCNEMLSTETAAMVKEHFVEQHGEPAYTIGIGGSSGAVSAYLTAQNYPGILDGIIVYDSAPDHITTVIPVFSDCALLASAIDRSKHPWTEAQRTAISGFATWHACSAAASYLSKLSWLDPKNCPVPIRKDMTDLPRCTFFDNAINTFGRGPTGAARRTLDNVGIQYGLIAFNSGQISAEQFIELNERVGGFDSDGQIVRRRSVADEDSIKIARNYGIVLTGNNLGDIPIVDWTIYSDTSADIHTRDRPLITRLRLVAANGDARNQAIIVTPRLNQPPPTNSNIPKTLGIGMDVLIQAMDRWLDNISSDSPRSSRLESIVHSKPRELEDHCVSAQGQRIFEPATYRADTECNRLYPIHGNPRGAAGAPRSGDNLKCVLKRVDPSDYKWELTSQQLERLKSAFPAGVCDYRKPGVDQQTEAASWQPAQSEPAHVSDVRKHLARSDRHKHLCQGC